MELTRNECLDCHVIYPGNENHSCKNDKISCGSFKKALLNRYIKENGASTSNVQYVRGTQTVDSNILADNTMKHAESCCHTEELKSNDAFVNVIPNSQNFKFPEWEQDNLQYDTTQKQLSNPNSLRENHMCMIPKKPHVYDPEFLPILQAHYEQPSSNTYNRIPVEVYRMKVAENNRSVHFNNDHYKHKSLENDCIERLISSTNTSKVEDISETSGFADGQNDVRSLNESIESQNNDKLVASISDANRVSDTLGLSFETQYRIENGRYICLLCDKSYAAKSNYVIHFRNHSGAKPYACGKCGRRFAQISTLNHHLSTHTKEKSFLCSLCQKRFSRSDSLVRHMRRTHTGKKRHSVCEKNFSNN